MSLRLTSEKYTTIDGTVIDQYTANAGDIVFAEYVIESCIDIFEDENNRLSFDLVNNEVIYSGNGDGFLKEGFSQLDQVNIQLFNKNDGSFGMGVVTNITFLSENRIRVTDNLHTMLGNNYDENDYIRRVVALKDREQLQVEINHYSSDIGWTNQSLIDQEKTVSNIVLGQTNNQQINGTFIGNQSGQYLFFTSSTKIANVPNIDPYINTYRIRIGFIQSGIYNQDSFLLGNCLNFGCDLKFSTRQNQFTHQKVIEVRNNSNTGWFDEAYNGHIKNSKIVSGKPSELAYNQESTHTINYATSNGLTYDINTIRIGSSFYFSDPELYKNKASSQAKNSNTCIPLGALSGSLTSALGNYQLEIVSFTTTQLVFKFKPLAGFNTWIESLAEDDRRLIIWVKVGNVNHIVFDGILYKKFDIRIPLNASISTLLRHNENVQAVSINNAFTKTNTMDDLAYFAKFTLTNGELFEGARFKIVAFNATDNLQFTLLQQFFSFANVQRNAEGRYLLNIQTNVNNNLPSTSAKKVAKLKNNKLDNTVEFYFPFINDWRYWVEDEGVDVSFYPNQNKDWQQFDNGDWAIKIIFSIEGTVLEYFQELPFEILNFDEDTPVNSTMQLFRQNGDLANKVFEGEQMTIEFTHDMANKSYGSVWGEITAQVFESGTCWYASSVIDYDQNSQNPLYPISGSGTSATIENGLHSCKIKCKFDTTKLNGNKIAFSSKIFFIDVDDDVIIPKFEFQDNTHVETQGGILLDTQTGNE